MASILITSINIIAGFLIGVLQHGMELRHALETYTVLTIGDGLVTVIPALMISVSGGLIVTRSNSDVRVGTEFQRQLFGKPEPLLLSSGVLLVLAAFPGLPAIPFLLLGSGLGAVGWIKRKKIDRSVKEEAAAAAPALAPKDDLESLLRVEPLAIEVGLGLAGLVAGGKASPLLKRIAGIRRQFVNSLGYLLPPVRVTDNLSLRSREYVVLLKGSEIGRYELMPGSELAIPTSKADKNFSGQQTREPAFGLPALWIAADKVDVARGAGYTVVDAVNILGTHLAELVRQHSSEMFSRQDAKMFCDRIGQENPKLLEDLVPKLLSFGVIQKVLQNLLRERVSIRDGVSILEALSEAARHYEKSCLVDRIHQTIDPPHGRKTVFESEGRAAGVLFGFFDRADDRIGGPAQRAKQRAGAVPATGPRSREPARADARAARGGNRGHGLFRWTLFPAPDARIVAAQRVSDFP